MKTHNNQKPSHDYRIGVGQLDSPAGLMIHRCVGSGAPYHLYIADFNNHRIQVFNPVDGSYIRSIGQGMGAGPGQLNCPTSCTALLGPEGGISELYVSEQENHRVSVFDMARGAFKRHIGAGLGTNVGQMGNPKGIALSLGCVDSQGGDHLLYVSEYYNNRIKIANGRTGAHVGYLAVGELSKHCGMRMHKATDNRSMLFVSDLGNKRIQIYEV
jgi:DNA-binding beta-propeller fold protein YncE